MRNEIPRNVPADIKLSQYKEHRYRYLQRPLDVTAVRFVLTARPRRLTDPFSGDSFGVVTEVRSILSHGPIVPADAPRQKASERSISIKKKADRIRLLRVLARIARRAMKSRLPRGLFRGARPEKLGIKRVEAGVERKAPPPPESGILAQQ